MNDHNKKFLGLADRLGLVLTFPFMGYSIDDWKGLYEVDEHLNNVPLRIWDERSIKLRHLFLEKGESWSLSNGVCVLKALVRKEVTK